MAHQGEGSLKAPTRHPLAWQTDEFYDESSLVQELERVFDTCHGCRWCFNLCNAFPTLFDAVDESDTGELNSVDRKVYWKVVDHCYLCDMCFMSIWAIANDDLERSTDEKTSTSEMVQTLKGGAPVAVGIEHQRYCHQVDPVPEAVSAALAAGLD